VLTPQTLGKPTGRGGAPPGRLTPVTYLRTIEEFHESGSVHGTAKNARRKKRHPRTMRPSLDVPAWINLMSLPGHRVHARIFPLRSVASVLSAGGLACKNFKEHVNSGVIIGQFSYLIVQVRGYARIIGNDQRRRGQNLFLYSNRLNPRAYEWIHGGIITREDSGLRLQIYQGITEWGIKERGRGSRHVIFQLPCQLT
jgi:hypothetical protein